MDTTVPRSAAALQQPTATDRYTRLPDQLLAELTPREHQVVHALLSYRWTDDAGIYPSVTTLAERLHCSDRTIQRTLHQLADRGYLIIQARYRDDRGQTSNLYVPGPALSPLLPPSGYSGGTVQAPLWHPPVTPRGAQRYSGNQTNRTTRPERPDLRAPDRDFTMTRYGRLPGH